MLEMHIAQLYNFKSILFEAGSIYLATCFILCLLVVILTLLTPLLLVFLVLEYAPKGELFKLMKTEGIGPENAKRLIKPVQNLIHLNLSLIYSFY